MLDQQNVPLCAFGWLRCGTEHASGSLWIEPTNGTPILTLGAAGLLALVALSWFEGQYGQHDHELVQRRPRTRVLVLIGIAVTLAAAHLLLFSPVPDKLLCAQTVRMNSAMSYPLNCDSPAFLDLAHHPAKLLQPGDARQSRPGYVYLGAALTAVLGPIVSATGLNRVYATTDTAYLPLVLINLAVAALALVLFCRLLLRLGVGPMITGLLATIMAVNDLTKAYYWSPHQAMLTLLVPVLTILLGQWLLRRDPGLPRLALLGLGLGLGMLVYGSFVIPIVVAGLLVLVTRRRPGPRSPTMTRSHRPAPALVGPSGGMIAAAASPAEAPSTSAAELPTVVSRRHTLLRLSVVGVLATAPTLIWIGICEAVAGSYFNNETVTYHEFVWLPESIGAGPGALGSALGKTIVNTTQELLQVAWLPAILIAGMVAAAVLAGVRLGARRDTEAGAGLIATMITGAVTVVFLYAIGFWAYRITYTIMPVLLVVLGWTAARLSEHSRPTRWAVTTILTVTVAAWISFQLLSQGPYS
jgi:hypothetical protein